MSGLTDIVSIDAGTFHTCAVLADGTARCWGWNGNGELGNGTSGSANSIFDAPTTVVGLADAVDISTGQYHSSALLGDETVRCWGHGGNYQHGNGITANSNVPVTTRSPTPPPSSGHALLLPRWVPTRQFVAGATTAPASSATAPWVATGRDQRTPASWGSLI